MKCSIMNIKYENITVKLIHKSSLKSLKEHILPYFVLKPFSHSETVLHLESMHDDSERDVEGSKPQWERHVLF